MTIVDAQVYFINAVFVLCDEHDQASLLSIRGGEIAAHGSSRNSYIAVSTVRSNLDITPLTPQNQRSEPAQEYAKKSTPECKAT